VKPRRFAAPILALGLGTVAILAAAGGSLAVSSNVAGQAEPATVACGTVPLDVEIILDTSGSMGSNSSNGHTRLYWAQAAATQLVNQLDGSGGVGGASGLHHVGLTKFSGTTATVVRSLGTSTAAQMDASIAGLAASGNTPFKTGMSAGAANLTANKRTTANGLTVTHIIIFLSDGRPNPDQSGRDGLVATSSSYERPTQTDLNAFKGSADTIFSIAIGSGGGSGSNLVDLGLMQLLAKPSGNYYNVVNSSLLPTLFGSIFTEIACPTQAPTEAPTAAPTEKPTEGPTTGPTEGPTTGPTEGPTTGPTTEPTTEPTDTPFENAQGETATPAGAGTPPPTSSGSGSGGGSVPLMALLICLAFGGLGLTAAEAQRRSLRR
jgi:hypothetical protein